MTLTSEQELTTMKGISTKYGWLRSWCKRSSPDISFMMWSHMMSCARCFFSFSSASRPSLASTMRFNPISFSMSRRISRVALTSSIIITWGSSEVNTIGSGLLKSKSFMILSHPWRPPLFYRLDTMYRRENHGAKGGVGGVRGAS